MVVDQTDISKIKNLYNGRFLEHGSCLKSVGWSSQEDQFLRFKMLLRGIDITGKSVLDVGCGLGGFVEFCDKNKLSFGKYLGIDLSEEMVSEASKVWVDRSNTKFSDQPLDSVIDKYDVVLVSGALNLSLNDNHGFIRKFVDDSWARASGHLTINFLSTFVDYQNELNFHTDPMWIFGEAKKMTKYVTLLHDYRLWEFTIQMHRNPQG